MRDCWRCVDEDKMKKRKGSRRKMFLLFFVWFGNVWIAGGPFVFWSVMLKMC